MDDRATRLLKLVAVALAVGFVGWAAYDHFAGKVAPGDMAYHAGNRAFEDGEYARAVIEFQRALAEAPDHVDALRGLAISLHQAGRHDDALTVYEEVIARASAPPPDDDGARAALAATFANRGILLDTMGRHEAALEDYDRALAIHDEVAQGPHWLTRFLRNQPLPPPTVADRARYLRAELAKPAGERVLLVPELDAQQRPYQQ
jgi:tetratricopeptide (TPR) repeat protein